MSQAPTQPTPQPLTGPLANIAAGATQAAPVTADADYGRTMLAYANAPGGSASLGKLLEGQTWEDAYQNSWAWNIIGRKVYREVTDALFPDDADFNVLEDQNWSTYTQGVLPEFQPIVARAKSVPEAIMLQTQAQESSRRLERTIEAGYAGLAANLMASIVSPEGLVSLGAGAAAGAVRGGITVSATRSAVTAGLVNAGTQVPFDVLRATEDPLFRGADVAAGFVSNFAMGAASPLTANLGAVQRFSVGGMAANAGLPIQMVMTDMDAAEVRVALATQFLLGGSLNAIPVGRAMQDADDTARIAKMAPDMKAEAQVQAAATVGATPTPAGEEVLNTMRRRREAAPIAVEAEGLALFDAMTEQPVQVRRSSVPPAEPVVQPMQAEAAGSQPQPRPIAPVVRSEAELKAASIVTGGDIGLGGTNISPSLSGGVNRISPDPTYKPGDYSSQDVTWDKPTGAERLVSTFAVFSQGQQIVRNNDVTAMRVAAAMLVGDMRGNNAASLLVQRHSRMRSFESQYNQRVRSSLEEHNQWRATRGLSPVDQKTFNREITQAYYADAQGVANFDSSVSPVVAKEAKWHAEHFRTALSDAKRKNSPAAKVVPDGAKYLPHQWSRAKIDGAIAMHKSERPVFDLLVKAAYPEALSDAWRAINGAQMTFGFDVAKVEAAARLAAESKADRIIRNAGTHKDVMAQIDGLTVEESVEATFARYRASQELRDVSDENLRQFVMARARKPEDVVPIYKSSIALDMTARHEWTDALSAEFGRSGPPRVNSLAVTDLLEDDIAAITMTHFNNHDGHLAMLEFERGMSDVLQRNVSPEGERPRLFLTPGGANEFLRQYITDNIGEVKGMDARHLSNLSFYMRQLAGGPSIDFATDDAANAWRMTKGMMNVTSARVMMNPTAPLQNTTELATALAQSHPAVLRKIVPTLDTAMKALANGKADSATARYAYDLGIGQSLASGRPLVLMDDNNVSLMQAGQTGMSRAGDVTQRTAQNLSHYAYLASGNTSTQDAVEKGVLHTALAHFEMLADGEIKWRALDLEQFGLSQKRLESIIADMQTHRKKNSAGFYDFNEDKWQPENAAAFRRALLGWTTRYGNIKNAGLMPAYFQNNVPGQLVSQMAPFGIQSTQNRMLQPLYNAARVPANERLTAAAQAATSYVVQSVGGSLTYAMGIYLASLGRPDAEEYRARMLSDETLALTLFSRAAWAGMMPRVIDMGLQATGNNPIFAPMRGTQLGSAQGLFGLAGQTPLGSYAASLLQMPNTLWAMMDEEVPVTQRDMRRIEEVTLFPSAYMNFRNGLSHLYQAAEIPTAAEASEARRRQQQQRAILPANNN
jgi:hypothetical protein